MARNDKAPFTRSFTITAIGVVADEIYVGDLKTLYISMNPIASANVAIEGKIGRSGKYFNVAFSLTNGNSGPVDISHVEYIKFTAIEVGATTILNMFAYEDADAPTSVNVYYEDETLNRDVLNTSLLTDIRDELKTLNTYMSVITGEELGE